MALLSYKGEGNYGSFSSLDFSKVPPLCVITGENGAGKTQLLELLADAHNAQRASTDAHHIRSAMGRQTFPVEITCDGNPFTPGGAFFASAKWVPVDNITADADALIEAAHSLYERPDKAQSNDPLFDDWDRIQMAPVEEGLRPGWGEFLTRLKPKHLTSTNPNHGNENLAAHFLSYQLLKSALQKAAIERNQDPTSATEHLGEAPWDLFNRFCQEADIGFEVVPPTIPAKPSIFSKRPPPYKLAIRDLARGREIDIDKASTGERIILAIVAWRFWREVNGTGFDVILLDEPEAHLHPSLVRRFLSVLENVLVRQHGVRVIMTTHSPTTAALAPKGSLFELRRHDEPRIVPVEEASAVVAKLTGGFVTVDLATKFVMLEGPTDPAFYQCLYLLMRDAGMPLLPSISFTHNGGATTVKSAIRLLRKHGMTKFVGIIDRDGGADINEEEEGIYVLERNGIENYIFDPLNIWFCLWMHGRLPETLHQIPTLRHGATDRFKSLGAVELQAIVDSVWLHIRSQINQEDWMSTTKEVEFVGGLRLQYPRWFIDYDDHTLATSVRNAFKGYPFPERDIHRSYNFLGLIPLELWNIFTRIIRD